ncbi:hypothetical protein [Bacillus mobilis]
MVVDAILYMYAISLSAGLGLVTAVLIGLKIYNRKSKVKQQRDVIG